MYHKAENELYRLKVQEKTNKRLLLNGYRNGVTRYTPDLPVYPGDYWNSTLKQTMTASFLIVSIHQL
jgi:hypothetical protein